MKHLSWLLMGFDLSYEVIAYIYSVKNVLHQQHSTHLFADTIYISDVTHQVKALEQCAYAACGITACQPCTNW